MKPNSDPRLPRSPEDPDELLRLREDALRRLEKEERPPAPVYGGPPPADPRRLGHSPADPARTSPRACWHGRRDRRSAVRGETNGWPGICAVRAAGAGAAPGARVWRAGSTACRNLTTERAVHHQFCDKLRMATC